MSHPALPDRPPVGNAYPDIGSLGQDQGFRLAEIRRVRKDLEDEALRHRATKQRYKRAGNSLTGTSIAMNTVSATCGGASVATLAGGVTIPVSLALGGAALGSGAIAAVCTVVGKFLSRKITKHQRIETSAATHLDTISAVVSKALTDQTISHDEYAAILRQADQYRRKRAVFQAAGRQYGSTEKAKNDLKAQVREEVEGLLGGLSLSR